MQHTDKSLFRMNILKYLLENPFLEFFRLSFVLTFIRTSRKWNENLWNISWICKSLPVQQICRFPQFFVWYCSRLFQTNSFDSCLVLTWEVYFSMIFGVQCVFFCYLFLVLVIVCTFITYRMKINFVYTRMQKFSVLLAELWFGVTVCRM